MKIVVIDGQGGGVGKQVIASIRANLPKLEITAIGTNSAATAAMLKAGATNAATGENAVVVACRSADAIIGPVGITIADALLGEITPTMAVAVGQSTAEKLLFPINHCNNIVLGVSDLTIKNLVDEMIKELKKMV